MSAHELRLEGLSVRYGHASAVTGADIVAPGGVVTALVGPNGAGKSSALLAAYGSVAATGRVFLDGEDVSRLKPADRARAGIAVVPQGRQLFPKLNVADNLQVMAELLRLPRSAVQTAIDRFPILRTRMKSLVGVLSGGEQQMLVVTRALMGSPRVLLLDEMMTGLAPLVVQELLRTVTQLAADGVAVLMAEPALGAVRGAVDRGYVLVRGEVVATREDGGAALDDEYRARMGVLKTAAH
ncbi:ATP-binding cassette domain-containing protein [Dactylosporangium aurantiacum]|uniref:ATP-binding cassette domain-containing protein n=1 Tax=Dactylosporangium aurantiacum TaxID=35754 RepID=A0A9Q9MC70_9ACTN|nr:ATP-binding cassette domain-containing protein [Dactylosporangium aurantiacum]MDG6107047.1 ATP-binding cassette domain-containing protein [Dactylosporangium aurantiacum]UWZ50604.1 ATP-binding cassette domain-containing protein [Dactylosporangium aurantiacum]